MNTKSAVIILIIAVALLAISLLTKSPPPPYQDARHFVDIRIEDLLGRMTREEKIGQLALVSKDGLEKKKDIIKYGLGGLLSGGGAKPDPNTPTAWRKMVQQFQNYARRSRLSIPILYGIDAVHGHANVPGATIFPHNIGLAATRDSDLVRRIGAITAQEMAATGIYWNFAPSVDVAHDQRWGRIYETFGSDTELVTDLSTAYLEGLQSTSPSVLGTVKHYLGTGDMLWNSSQNSDFSIDQGMIVANETTLRSVHLPPYISAIDAGAKSIMVSHAQWHNTEFAASHYWLTEVLKNELGYDGFVVSDWGGVNELEMNTYESTVIAINAGIDMMMLPFDYKTFTLHMQQALDSGDISEERLNDAVQRILRAKFTIGLFDSKARDLPPLHILGSGEHRLIAREAVRKSVVVLKDESQTLPLSKSASQILVSGSIADNLGYQSGGWTIEWQGVDGNSLAGTTILQAIRSNVAEENQVEYSLDGNFADRETLADIGIAVVGEAPYAEGWGDNAYPSLTPGDLVAIEKTRAASKKLVVIIVSGRPLDITPYAHNWDAVIAAWLPGTEGLGITDVLFGDYPFSGTLPVEWPI